MGELWTKFPRGSCTCIGWQLIKPQCLWGAWDGKYPEPNYKSSCIVSLIINHCLHCMWPTNLVLNPLKCRDRPLASANSNTKSIATVVSEAYNRFSYLCKSVCDFLCSEILNEIANTLEHRIRGILNLCPQAIVIHICLQNKLFLVPLKRKLAAVLF